MFILVFLFLPPNIFGQTWLCGRRHSKPVAPFILWVVVMASDPGKLDTVFFKQVEKLAPQIHIPGFFLLVAHPPVCLPLAHPAFLNSIYHITRIADHCNLTGFFESRESSNDGHHFHTIIRGVAKTAREFFRVSFIFEDDAVASRTGVTRTGAVCIKGDFLHGNQ